MSVKDPVPFLDLSKEFSELESEWFEMIRATGASGRYILGPNVGEFETELAAKVGTQHAVSCGNGTDALMLSLRALQIGPGDEVITTPYTFYATSEVISMVGATPVFADILPECFTIDPASIKAKITERTKAIMPVHIFGHPARMDEINAIAAEHKLAVIEDAAQAFGAEYNGKLVGSLGTTGGFSFYPTKVLGCYGDGGIITLNDESLVEELKKLRNHGATAPFMHDTVGYNSRLDEIQAGVLRIKLRKIDDDLARRRAVAARYTELLAGSDVVTPSLPENGKHAFNLYTIRLPDRDRVRQVLADNGIPSSLCYPLGLHLQEVYKDLGYKVGDLPVCDKASTEALSLPVYPEMKAGHIERIAQTILDALK
ncbi:MAG: DegT/DnrJ/EryC1/StrS family aminotransferase [Granulosicoccaceae bacterium]|jgi:dTDP-4-amino-4,6-dideoxygalactose transaminase